MSRELSQSSPGARRDGQYKAWRKLNALSSYSSSGAASGQLWIDDKPIYRKVIDLGALPDSTSKNVAHGLTGIGEVISLRGIANDDSAAFAAAHALPSDVIGLSMDATNVTVTTASDLMAFDQAYAVVEYTLA